jgi:hypothetical protein
MSKSIIQSETMNDIENYGEIEYWGAHVHPNVRAELLVFGKEYLRYATWEKKHQYMLVDSHKTFQEILQDEFDGELEAAMTEFLIPEFYNTTLQDMADWAQEYGFVGDCDRELLNVMKWFVMNCDLDELKELLELEMPCLK